MINAVELVNISKVFKGSRSKPFIAVENLNLEIAAGEFFSLLGPSGCGKTTTLRMIAGFELPSCGEIYIHEQPMNNRPPFHRPVNTVFQNYALFPHLTVSQNVAFGLEMENLPRPQIRHRVGEALALVQLSNFHNRYPRQLSGGQQQRVALARALVKQPKVLLFDEPLGALDLKLRKEMQLELKRMQQQLGITFVYVTHDQEEALTMSDRIGVMYQGQLLQVGTPVEVYEYPKTRFVADFIGETNFLTARVSYQQGDQVILWVDKRFPLEVRYAEPLAVGQIVSLVVRPEKVSLYPQDNPVKGWRGIIEEAVYLGTDTRYRVRFSKNCAIAIRQQNLHRDQIHRYQVGEAVKVVLFCDSVNLLTE